MHFLKSKKKPDYDVDVKEKFYQIYLPSALWLKWES